MSSTTCSETPAPTNALSIRGVTTRGVRVPLTFALGTSAAIVKARSRSCSSTCRRTRARPGARYLFCYTPSGARAVAGHLTEAVELLHGLPANPQGEATLNAVAAVRAARRDRSGSDGALRPGRRALGCTRDRRSPPSRRACSGRSAGRYPPMTAVARAHGAKSPGRRSGGSARRRIQGRQASPRVPDPGRGPRCPASVRARVPAHVTHLWSTTTRRSRGRGDPRGLALQDEGIAWLEEPIRHDDYRGERRHCPDPRCTAFRSARTSTARRPC